MNSPQQVELLVGRYRKALQKLDRLTDRLTDAEKTKYKKLKSRFEAQMTAWEWISVSETNQLNANLQESYNEIESIWYSAHKMNHS